jgi:hypothetical protein
MIPTWVCLTVAGYLALGIALDKAISGRKPFRGAVRFMVVFFWPLIWLTGIIRRRSGS